MVIDSSSAEPLLFESQQQGEDIEMEEKTPADNAVFTAGVEYPDSSSLDMEDKAVMAQMGKKQQLTVCLSALHSTIRMIY